MTTTIATPAAIEGHAEIVADHDLAAIRSNLESQRDQLIAHENRFKQTALPHYLTMGLACLKAHAVFAVPNDQRQGIGGRPKKTPSTAEGVSGETSSTAEELSGPASFDAWLKAECPWLPVATAYRYKRAAQGLGLTHSSAEDEIRTLLDAAREAAGKPVSLNQLAALVPPPVPEQTEDPNDDQDKAGEARVQIVSWIDRWDTFEKAGGLEDADVPTLKSLEEFHRNSLDRITRRLKSAR